MIIDGRNITVKERDVYGLKKLYIVSDQANAISQLTGRKTLTASDCNALHALGYEIHTTEGKAI